MSEPPIGTVWELASSRGWESLRCAVRTGESADEGEGVLLDVSLAGEFWDRRTPLEDADLVRDCEARFHQVLVSPSALRELEVGLREWLNRLAEERAAIPLELRCELGVQYQQFCIEFGATVEGILSEGKPVVTVTLSRGDALRVVSTFVTDPSCVREFVEALGSHLRVRGVSS